MLHSSSLFTESLAHKLVKLHFVNEPDIDYQCPVCFELFTEPLAEPLLTDCGHYLCAICHDHLLNTSKAECPTCREPKMLNNARLDKYLQRKVRSLEVSCPDFKEGCEWVGELGYLHNHLDPAKRECGSCTACPFGCGKYAFKSEMREHKRHCHKRMISCEDCGYYNTFTIVTEKHYPICPQSPIDCPNHCLVENLKRHQLEQHLNECNHQIMDCPCRKTFTGCSVRLPRRKMKLHTLQQHNIVLEETDQAVAITPATVSPQYLHNQTPMEFIISNFQEKKKANEVWYSSPFYTHNRGYKFCIRVYPNGYGTGIGFYLSVYAALMRGEYDKELQWPFEGDIIPGGPRDY